MESHPVQTTFFLSLVLGGIAMSAKTSASLRKALGFRVIELPTNVSWGKKHGPDRIEKQMADIPVSRGMEDFVGSRPGGGEVGPTGTSATAVSRACTSASVSGRGAIVIARFQSCGKHYNCLAQGQPVSLHS